MKKYFEMNEEKALKDAFEEARRKGKLFDVMKWKLKREDERIKRGIEVK